MTRKLLFALLATNLVLAGDRAAAQQAGTAAADPSKAEPAKTEPAKPEEKKPEEKSISGMSILGNQDAPKALVIVPWKSSELGDSMGISTVLDDSRQPVDKDVFMRALSYYEIKSGTNKSNAAQSATAAPRRK